MARGQPSWQGNHEVARSSHVRLPFTDAAALVGNRSHGAGPSGGLRSTRTNANSHAGTLTDGHARANSNARAAYTDAATHAYIHIDPAADAHGHIDAATRAFIYTDPAADANAHTDPDANARTHINLDTHTDPDANANALTHTNLDAHTDPDPDADTHSKAQTRSGSSGVQSPTACG